MASFLLAIREMQTKTAGKCHPTSIRMAKIVTLVSDKQIRQLIHCWREWKKVQLLCETTWQFLKKKKKKKRTKHTTITPPRKCLGYSSREMKTWVHIPSCMQMFTAAFLSITQNWKHPRPPSAGDWSRGTLHGNERERTADTSSSPQASPEAYAE